MNNRIITDISNYIFVSDEPEKVDAIISRKRYITRRKACITLRNNTSFRVSELKKCLSALFCHYLS